MTFTQMTRFSLRLCLITILLLSVGTHDVSAKDNQDTYNYSYWGEAVPAPPAYLPTLLINSEQLETEPLKTPNDLYVSDDRYVYIADSGNNRIVILDDTFQFADTIEGFIYNQKEETFLNPQGVFVTKDNHIYIADTGNQRVVHLDEARDLVKIIEKPDSELLADNFSFRPQKVVADEAGRVFVMVEGVFDGFMEFSIDGYFTTFIGANRVQVDPLEYLWRRFATQEQRSQMVMFIPTEFTGLDIDDDGFLYATNADDSDDMIKKINARGDDILRREGLFNPVGDILYTTEKGPSRLSDITVAESGIYSVLDQRRGRIFTYNGDGHLMYVFGSTGNRLGQFQTPVAIEQYDDFFLVLDRDLGEITVFEVTNYGATLNHAVKQYDQGDEVGAFDSFKEVVKMNTNLEFAYTGIGKALLRQDDFKQAMYQFKQSLDQQNYSKAYLLYRNKTLREHFTTIMTVIILTIVIILGIKFYIKSKRKRVS